MPTDLAALSLEDWEEEYHRTQNHICHSASILRGELAKPPPLIHGLLLERTVTMISAEPFCGKTMLTLAMALALDTGTPLFGSFAVKEPMRVLYLGQDAPDWDYAEQLRKLARGLDLSDSDVSLDLILNQGLNLLDQKTMGQLQDLQRAVGYQAIFFDVLGTFHNADENSNREMGIVMTILKKIRDEFGCAVIFTHHTAKPVGDDRSLNYGARGASAIAGSIDFHLSLRREATSGDRIRMRLPKGRGAETFQKLTHFEIIDAPHPLGPAILLTMPNEESEKRQGLVLQFLDSQNRTRAEVQTYLSEIEPALLGARLSWATDNTLALLFQTKQAIHPTRGTWRKAS